MKIEIDTHTHTIISGHAFSTILENVRAAKENGLKGIVMTEHGPAMENAPPDWHIMAIQMLPEEIEGIRVYRGVEANIMNYSGEIDIKAEYMETLDFAIASLHDITIECGTAEENTQAILCALNNPYIDAIGHPGNPFFPVDQVAIVKEAKRQNKMLEINNHSFQYRKGSLENCEAIIQLCRQYDVRICVSSDAHFCKKVGAFENALAKIYAAGFPSELILNATQERFEAYLQERKLRM